MHAVKRAYGTVDVESVCRLCSSNSGIIVLNIFDGEGKKRRILSLINACLPVKVSENDPLPKVICHHCLHKLEVFHEFQESCLKSEETLRNGVTCTETFLEFKTDSQEYAHECEDTVSQFPTELLPVQDPFSPKQCTTAVTPPTERSEECTVAERRDVFENSPSGKVEVIMVKEEPDEKGTEVYEDKGWHHTSLVEDNMQTEQTEIDLLPLDDEVKSESCTTMDPPVIRPERDLLVTKTIRGNHCLLLGQYKYRKAHETRGGIIMWRCTNRACNAVLKTNLGCTTVFYARNVHSHEKIGWQKKQRNMLYKKI
ncbi:uncharacterized protein LOC110827459 isoform X5 [Zootermopsis nevadensis]|uniref:uncharacterized protein LOC110827459 isoform X5 n=1 Tax=Zootermopsis nevadensis TaxID=136037 RepID=UPI000B8E4DE5|nr:uncharacterized protein LOC110827459 isoform X5 [Zootermopsis nevadensis]